MCSSKCKSARLSRLVPPMVQGIYLIVHHWPNDEPLDRCFLQVGNNYSREFYKVRISKFGKKP